MPRCIHRFSKVGAIGGHIGNHIAAGCGGERAGQLRRTLRRVVAMEAVDAFAEKHKLTAAGREELNRLVEAATEEEEEGQPTVVGIGVV